MITNLNNSLGGGSLPLQGGSLADHANTMVQAAQQQPIGSPQRIQMFNTGLQLANAHAQSLPPADGYVVAAPDGKNYAFPTPEAAGEFKQRIASQTTGSLGDLGQGIVAGFIKGTSGFQQLLNNTLGKIPGVNGGDQTLGDITNAPTGTAMGRLGTGVGQTLPYVAAGALTAGAGAAPLGAADIAAGAGLGDVAAAAIPEAATQFATGALGTQGGVGQRLGTGLAAGALTEAGAVGGAYAGNALNDLKGYLTKSSSNVTGEQGAAQFRSLTNELKGQKLEMDNTFAGRAQAITDNNPDLKLNLTQSQVDELNSLRESKNFALPESITSQMPMVASIEGNEFPIGKAALELNPELADIGSKPAMALNPSQAQELITQLDRATYLTKASGEMQVNQQLINLTKEIKSAAQDAFDKSSGGEWSNIYSDYREQITALKQLSQFVNTPDKITASFKTPLKAAQLKNAITDYKNLFGVDLTDPVQAARIANQIPTQGGKTAFLRLLKKTGIPAAEIAALYELIRHH